MRPIALNFLTMYADLQQAIGFRDKHGSISVRKIKGKEYLYVTTKDGATRRQKSLGPASSPEAQAKAYEIRDAADRARNLRTTIAALKQARIPSPALPLGRVLETISNAGLFDRGVVLVGTAAFQTYACVVGHYLPSSALMTNDADLLVASFAANGTTVDIETILRRADPTFKAHMSREDRMPKVFRSADGFQVDLLTKYGRGRSSPILIEELGCAAEALSFMEYLAEESVEAVALYGTGVLVRVPPPMRYAVHKLVIAQERRGSILAKKQKDLAQAKEILDIFSAIEPDALEDALDEARNRGPAWKKNINASLREIGRDARQVEPPLKLEKHIALAKRPVKRATPGKPKKKS